MATLIIAIIFKQINLDRQFIAYLHLAYRVDGFTSSLEFNTEPGIDTKSSATAEKQRVSCACLYRLALTDIAMHRIQQNRRFTTRL